ncbi:MAG: peptidoglycan DD-metalloendopeptidase family protein, partial [Acidobacteriota bacterium]|nr:peptidoglycan DD-metalloendopeptidase family protein [Acidobacteriota bacterium]
AGAPGEGASLQGQRATWRHEPGEDGAVILRLQPELLSGGAVELEARVLGTLSFPVQGKDRSAVRSIFGDPRDGGRRSHEGVDIFASRGTPAVAAGDGVVSRVGTNRLGGNVVWMRTGGLNLYYAHLDEATVSFGQRLAAGDEVGKVGNTGNARHTPPHLHFGVYDGGARDPLRFLDPLETEPAAVTASVEALARWARVSGARVRLRQGPSTGTAILTELPRHTALRLHGARGSWYRVSLPDGTRGYIAASLTEAAERPVRQERLGEPRLLRSLPQPAGLVVGTLEPDTAVPVLASYEEHLLVQTPDGHAAWLGEPAPELNLASAS